jgi:hypothetical protein
MSIKTPATGVMLRRPYGNHVFGNVDTLGQAFFQDVGKMAVEFLGIDMGGVEPDKFGAGKLHFVVDGAGDDVTGCEVLAGIVLFHECRLVVLRAQNGAGTTHGFGDQKGGAYTGLVERGRMKLGEFHVGDAAHGAVHHRDAIACGDAGVGGRIKDIATAARGEHGQAREDAHDLFGLDIEGIDAVTFDAGSAAVEVAPEVVLCEQVDGEKMFAEGDVGMQLDSGQEGTFDFPARSILGVEDAAFGVAALAAKAEGAVFAAVEPGAIVNKLLHTQGAIFDDHAHHFLIAKAIARVERVGNMGFEGVHVGNHGGDATLRILGIALVFVALGDDEHLAQLRRLERKRQSGHAGTDHQKICANVHVAKVGNFCFKRFAGYSQDITKGVNSVGGRQYKANATSTFRNSEGGAIT